MKVIITGGTGFVGTRLALRLLERGELTGPDGRAAEIDSILLFDAMPPAVPLPQDRRLSLATGDIAERDAVAALFDRPDLSVFHLASVVSGTSERDFDLAMRVNLTGHLALLEAARSLGSAPRYVFASTTATYGGTAMPQAVSDETRQVPQTTYGATKAIGELLVNDYTRKGFINGRAARLPTVIIRPGKPNGAASSFASGVFREPLNGEPCALPVDLSTVMPVTGYRTLVDNLIRLHELDGTRLGDDRALTLPSIAVTVEEMIAALRRAAGNRHLGEIIVAPDPAIERIVAGWPQACLSPRADALGLVRDAALEPVIEAYIADYLR